LIRSIATQFACCVVGLIFFAIGIPAVAQEITALRESPAIEPVITEESLPEEAGECNLRSTGAYHARIHEPRAALQLFCGFSRRWGGEFDLPLAQADGSYGLGEVGTTVKYKLRGQAALIPALVLGVETTFPIQRRDSDEGGVEVQPFVAVLKQMHGLTFQGNVGLAIRHSGIEREYQREFNGAVAVPLRHTGLGLLAEVNAESSASGTTPSFSPGIHYSLGKNCYMAFALPVSRRNGLTRLGAVFQFQMRVRRQRVSE
jgi:hypothetical protein